MVGIRRFFDRAVVFLTAQAVRSPDNARMGILSVIFGLNVPENTPAPAIGSFHFFKDNPSLVVQNQYRSESKVED